MGSTPERGVGQYISEPKSTVRSNCATDEGLALFGGFGVDGDAEDLREAFLDAIFEGRGDIVDARDGELALHDAMAGDEGVVLDLADAHVVAIEKLDELMRQGIE